MSEIFFVTGFHRAGTHSVAEYYASENNILYLDEDIIRWDSLTAVEMLCNGLYPKWVVDENNIRRLVGEEDPRLINGFVLQCPGLAHHVIELSEMGNVVWLDRNKIEIITSMVNAGINDMAWHLMKGFHERFPDDEIWGTLEYDGSEDVQHSFVAYYKLLLDVKDYFYDTQFKNKCIKVTLEDLSIYDSSIQLSPQKPLRPFLLEKIS